MQPGPRLGVLEIVAPIGAGVRGEVHGATGTWVGRDVALEVRPRRPRNAPDRLTHVPQATRAFSASSHPPVLVHEKIYGQPMEGTCAT